MNARTGLLMVGLFASTTAACGGGSSTPLTVSDFCMQKATAECGVASLCAVAQQDCETARTAACMSFVTTADVAPRVFVPGNVAACVSKTKSVFAKSLILATDLDAVTDVCNYVFQGPTADLAACATKYECKNSKDICDKGHCAAQTNVAAGGQCANFGAVCPAAQYCSTVGAAMMCVAKGAAGATCDASTPCDSTKMLTCTAGMCAAQSTSGGACTTDADCLATGATAAPYCNPYAGNKCSAGLTFSAGAASCSAYGGGANTGTAGASGGTAGASGSSDGAAGATGSDASTTDSSTTDAGDAAITG